MINAILAGFIVTISLLALTFEVVFNSRKPISKILIIFYGIGTLIWGYAGMYIESAMLMIVSSIQFTCCIIIYSQRIKDSKEQ